MRMLKICNMQDVGEIKIHFLHYRRPCRRELPIGPLSQPTFVLPNDPCDQTYSTDNREWALGRMLSAHFVLPSVLNGGTDVLETVFQGKEQNGERCQGCSVCQWSILWLDHINTNVAPQLALFDRLVHIIRHLHNSAPWDFVESVPPAGMCWFPIDDCQLLLEVPLKEICFVVSVCYIKQNPSWDAVLSCNSMSIFHICCVFSIYLSFLPPLHAVNSNLSEHMILCG